MGLGVEVRVAEMRTRIAARVVVGVAAGAVDEAEVALGVGAGIAAGGGVAEVLAAMEEDELGEAGVRVATLHCWERGV
jgi:hypothetical protein